jgi:hypothetical protein
MHLQAQSANRISWNGSGRAGKQTSAGRKRDGHGLIAAGGKIRLYPVFRDIPAEGCRNPAAAAKATVFPHSPLGGASGRSCH